MSRYIDADALRKSVNGVSTHLLNDWSTLGVLAMIDKQPTVDAVPVVRCRECKYAKDENFISAIWCENLEKYLAYDFFCHDGERRTDGK